MKLKLEHGPWKNKTKKIRRPGMNGIQREEVNRKEIIKARHNQGNATSETICKMDTTTFYLTLKTCDGKQDLMHYKDIGRTHTSRVMHSTPTFATLKEDAVIVERCTRNLDNGLDALVGTLPWRTTTGISQEENSAVHPQELQDSSIATTLTQQDSLDGQDWTRDGQKHNTMTTTIGFGGCHLNCSANKEDGAPTAIGTMKNGTSPASVPINGTYLETTVNTKEQRRPANSVKYLPSPMNSMKELESHWKDHPLPCYSTEARQLDFSTMEPVAATPGFGKQTKEEEVRNFLEGLRQDFGYSEGDSSPETPLSPPWQPLMEPPSSDTQEEEGSCTCSEESEGTTGQKRKRQPTPEQENKRLRTHPLEDYELGHYWHVLDGLLQNIRYYQLPVHLEIRREGLFLWDTNHDLQEPWKNIAWQAAQPVQQRQPTVSWHEETNIEEYLKKCLREKTRRGTTYLTQYRWAFEMGRLITASFATDWGTITPERLYSLSTFQKPALAWDLYDEVLAIYNIFDQVGYHKIGNITSVNPRKFSRLNLEDQQRLVHMILRVERGLSI